LTRYTESDSKDKKFPKTHFNFSSNSFLGNQNTDKESEFLFPMILSFYYRQISLPKGKGVGINLYIDYFNSMMKTFHQKRFDFNQQTRMDQCKENLEKISKWNDDKFKFVSRLVRSMFFLEAESFNLKDVVHQTKEKMGLINAKIGNSQKILDKRFMKEFKFIERDFLIRAKNSLEELKGALIGILKGESDEISVPVLDNLLELWDQKKLAYLCETGYDLRWLMSKIEGKLSKALDHDRPTSKEFTLPEIVQV
jgi:hypothetical protein